MNTGRQYAYFFIFQNDIFLDTTMHFCFTDALHIHCQLKVRFNENFEFFPKGLKFENGHDGRGQGNREMSGYFKVGQGKI